MVRACLTIPVLVLLAATCTAQVPVEPAPVSTTGLSTLVSQDRLQIRDIQLALAQAHITRLQAEAQIKSLEAQLGQTVESLKTTYSCQTCTLNADFTWTKPDPPKAPAMATTTPAPQKDGPNSKKE